MLIECNQEGLKPSFRPQWIKNQIQKRDLFWIQQE
ncbi:unnamed protein product, partial [Allacma fusca]